MLTRTSTEAQSSTYSRIKIHENLKSKEENVFFSILIQTETPSTMKKGFELFIKKRKTKIKLGAR